MDAEAGDEAAALRGRMVDALAASGAIRSAAIARAFRAVPRHVFLPGVDIEVVYRDEAVPTKWSPDGRPISSSSQPAIMAIMLEQLYVEPGQRVLEIGAGTGYNAALLARLVGSAGEVTTVDIDADLVERAHAGLAAAGASGVTAVCADGAFGWAPGAPFDRIVVTAGAWDIAPAWREQLAITGRIVLPLSLRGVELSVAFEPVAGRLESISTVDCGFMPLRGAMAAPGGPRLLGDRPGLFVDVDDDRPLDTAALYAALTAPGRVVQTGVEVNTHEVFGSLGLWLALREPKLVRLSAIGPVVELGLVPPLIAFPPASVLTIGLAADAGLAALVRLDPDPARPDAFQLGVRSYGSGRADLAEQLAAQVHAWNANGRPATSELRITAHPAGTHNGLTGTVVDKRYSTLELTW